MPAPPSPFTFFERPYPSANMVLVRGARPVLVDSGFGADWPETERLLREANAPPERLALVVSTHFHSDHVGGNHRLREGYGVRVAAHTLEGERVNRRDPDACEAEWLDQPVEPYRVDRLLQDGDVIETGEVGLVVVHTPGHTRGHLSLWSPEERVLLLGDAGHGDDVAWINPYREGEDALERAIASLERLSSLGARLAYSGHGPPVRDVPAALERARRRYEGWRLVPERLAWHACKRILAYALMLKGGIFEAELEPYLLGRAWFRDHARGAFGLEPQGFVEPLLTEMLRSKAAGWREGRLVALAPHAVPPPGWPAGPFRPVDWPP